MLRLAARWKIPRDVALAALSRDDRCIYCRREFGELGGPRGAVASWEHIVNDLTRVTLDNIGLCCVSCNSSKGVKALGLWLTSRYCTERGISSAVLRR